MYINAYKIYIHIKKVCVCLQMHSPVESVTMSPVERTAAWVLNNGQYEEDEEDSSSKKESKHVEKVPAKAEIKLFKKKCIKNSDVLNIMTLNRLNL